MLAQRVEYSEVESERHVCHCLPGCTEINEIVLILQGTEESSQTVIRVL